MAGAALRDAVADQRMVDTPSLLAYLPWLLLYPVSGHALPALLLFTGLLWIGLQSILGIALLAIASPWLLGYAEHVIARTGAGQATPPMFGGEQLYIGLGTLLRGLIGPLAVACAWLALDEGAARTALLLLATALLPAYLMVLALHGGVLAAFNPLAWLQAFVGLGFYYLPLAAVLAAVTALAVWVAGQLALAGTLLVLIYAGLCACHVVGFVLFHRAERFGLPATPRLTSAQRREQAAFDDGLARLLAQIDARLAARDPSGAADALLADAGPAGAQRRFHEALFEALQQRRRTPLLSLQGERLVGVLVAERQPTAALDVAEICLDQDARFVPATLAQTVALADHALRLKRAALLDRLLRAARTRFDDDQAGATLALIEARALVGLHGDVVGARAALAPALRVKDHPEHAAIVAYARTLARLG